MTVRFIDEHNDEFGVAPICEALQVAPSTYYAARSRPPSARAVEDERLTRKIERVHSDNYGVYGRRKVWTSCVMRASRSAATTSPGRWGAMEWACREPPLTERCHWFLSYAV